MHHKLDAVRNPLALDRARLHTQSWHDSLHACSPSHKPRQAVVSNPRAWLDEADGLSDGLSRTAHPISNISIAQVDYREMDLDAPSMPT